MRSQILPRPIRFFLIAATVSPLASCFSDPADNMAAQATGSAPPAQLCAQFREALEKLSAEGSLTYEDSGTAVIGVDVWMAMGAEGRDQLGRMLAFHASCVRKAGSADQAITIRNEMGNILYQRIVDTRVSAAAALED